MIRNSVNTLLAGSAAIALLGLAATAAPVQQAEQRFDGANEFSLAGFVGTLIVETGGDVLTVSMTGAADGGPLELTERDGTVSLTGDRKAVKELYRKGSPWQKKGWHWTSSKDSQEKFAEFLSDYPTITVRLPEGGDLSIDEAALIITATDDMGDVSMGGLYEAYGTLGRTESAAFGIAGMGELTAGDVSGDLSVSIAGSGSLMAANAGSTAIRISGSGDVELGDISSDFSVHVSGSGDVETGTIGGSVDVRISGSGDVSMGTIANALEIGINGSGDVEADEVNGPASIRINGSGDVDIGHGRAENFSVRINGGGDVSFGGVATNPDIRVAGSGDVDIKDYEGTVSVKGDGDVRIGDLTFND
ncbi:GIN domain-containing protein [Parvularcula sp. LCG005]|uniref:GIN domain-containing protein n=1 Tax=Parvularcula sp. LCG005 TaxID=3078805 RepID=UPI002942F6BA|nr:DUF2807 domain-containing protein [Parvularcula sp. LCG005]WOI52730.1 DUF2807 domain-containing protein [Parvularcula sp. LCG005]